MNKKTLALMVGVLAVLVVIILNIPKTNTNVILDVKANTNFDFSSEVTIDEDNKNLNNEVIAQKIAVHPEEVFNDVNETIYIQNDVTVKNGPYENSEDVLTINKYESMNLIGRNDLKYWKISYNDNIYYIDSNKIIFDKEIIDNLKAEEERIRLEEEAKLKAQQKREELNKQTRNPNWDGSVLTKRKGVNYGPTGKETYYNLPMEGVIRIMRRMGNTDEYWVREDGVKMLGDYIMCAANLNVFPRGTLVESSLGTCIVCDTGGFAVNNPYQLDIAVTW